MTDKEILDELISQKNWWEQRIKECHEKETGYKKELSKTNRLIELIQSKLEKQGRLLPDEWRQDNVEELTEFENAMMHIGGSFFGENAGLDPNDTNAIKEQANLLLELVPKQEWSEEDLMNKVMDWLPNAEKYVHINVDNNGGVHTVCYTDKMISDFREAMSGNIMGDEEPEKPINNHDVRK